MPKLIIVIPIHRPDLSDDEQISIRRTQALCSEYDICFVCPAGMPSVVGFEAIRREEFDPRFFRDIAGYNRLMLSASFYERFAPYEYMLICQTDAYLFANHLDDWCRRGYPYVGAPWINKRKYHGFGRVLLYLRAVPKRLLGRPFMPLDLENKVGNGGLSLRRIADFTRVCQNQSEEIDRWWQRSLRFREYNEDCFWAQRPEWQYPSAQEALTFAFDLSPADALAQNGGHLPMGCHGWNKPAYRSFWWPIIENIEDPKS